MEVDQSQSKRAHQRRRRRRDAVMPTPADDKEGNGNVTHSKATSDNTSSTSVDDKEGHLLFKLGENLTPRYKIHRKIGNGLSGQVVECWDRENEEMVAIKIARSVERFRQGALCEIDVLKFLGEQGNHCVQLKNWFDHQNHICLVFEKLGPSLHDFLWRTSCRPFSIDLVREIGRQLLESVASMHDQKLVHTDLKPDNICLVSPDHVKVPDYKGFWRLLKDCGCYCNRIPKSSAIKVIDFGSTDVDGRDPACVVTAQQYRAPEIILGLGWGSPCDVWSVGCILFELCSRDLLFRTTGDSLEHLAMMERVLGPLPRHILEEADRRDCKYVGGGRVLASPDCVKSVSGLARLQSLVKQHAEHSSAGDFMHLLQGLLKYDPRHRLTARQALKHPFFTGKKCCLAKPSFPRKKPAATCFFVKIKVLLAVAFCILLLYFVFTMFFM